MKYWDFIPSRKTKTIMNQEPISWPEIMTRPEVAIKTRQAENTLRYWASVGKGPKCFKVAGGRRVLYRRSDVEQWLQEQYEAAS
jgi:predicted DNA-binding transcriptional regulator AlpA